MVPKKLVLIPAVCLLLLIGIVLPTNAYAVRMTPSENITPNYDYISVIGATLTIGNKGHATAGGYVYYLGDYDSTLTIELQRQNGNGWSVVKSWEKSFTGKGHHSFEKEYYVTSGNTYRVVTIATIKQGNKILETATSTSSEVKY